MNNLMIDIETLGTDHTAPILSIGAVFFDPEEGALGRTFYKVIDLISAAEHSIIDADTVKWWMRQSEEARAIFNQYEAVTLSEALNALSEFISENGDPNKIKVWGNGSNFDNTILRVNFDKVGISTPWKFYNDRDVRTIVDVTRSVTGVDVRKEFTLEGTVHNALDDALHQVKYVNHAYKLLRDN
ncbi:MAG: 3'-5' exoribonuclease [Neisseriaceae bacterium]|nr:3'-5' exoribonuclease [Neisseriaceae bacterium]